MSGRGRVEELVVISTPQEFVEAFGAYDKRVAEAAALAWCEEPERLTFVRVSEGTRDDSDT